MTGWQREIEELHEFFADWIGGAVERSPQTFGRLEQALAKEFTFITTSTGVQFALSMFQFETHDKETVELAAERLASDGQVRMMVERPEAVARSGATMLERMEGWPPKEWAERMTRETA